MKPKRKTAKPARKTKRQARGILASIHLADRLTGERRWLQAGEPFEFAAPPRQGERIQLWVNGKPRFYTVLDLEHGVGAETPIRLLVIEQDRSYVCQAGPRLSSGTPYARK